MIVGERKQIDEIRDSISRYQKILVAGCGTCMKTCFAGGEREVGILASALRMKALTEGENKIFGEMTIERQCEPEFISELSPIVGEYDAILCLGCGAGVQALAERFTAIPVIPAVNTTFLGVIEEEGIFTEKCKVCGECIVAEFGGICPVARCSKSLLNGPCGGSMNGKCEVDPDMDCGWQLIYDRLKAIGELDRLEQIIEPKNWVPGKPGIRSVIRKDQIIP